MELEGHEGEVGAVEGAPIEGAQILDAVVREVLHQVEARPYATLAVAAGVGYVLGAGLPNWASRLMFSVGSRMALAQVTSILGGGGGVDQP